MSWIHWLLLILYIISVIVISIGFASAVGSIWDKPIKGFEEASKSLEEASKSLDRAKRGK